MNGIGVIEFYLHHIGLSSSLCYVLRPLWFMFAPAQLFMLLVGLLDLTQNFRHLGQPPKVKE